MRRPASTRDHAGRRGGVPRWQGHFILLCDFWSAYDVFPLKAVGLDERVEESIVAPMREAVAEHVTSFTAIADDDIDTQIEAAGLSDTFVITMDGGSYFRSNNFSFEITRAVFRLSDVLDEQFFRMAREGKPGFHSQTLRVRAQYNETAAGQPIVLCDDGLGTGRSVREVMMSLTSLGLEVSRIVVLLNPRGVTEVEGVRVETLIDTGGEACDWLSERDLFWGLPRSGVSFTRFDDHNPCFGLPYTIDRRMATSRIGLPEEVATSLRARCLEINRRFWLLLEEFHGGTLRFGECPRLAFVPEYVRTPSDRIVDFLDHVAPESFEVMSIARGGEMSL